jgi:hypothetical protein
MAKIGANYSLNISFSLIIERSALSQLLTKKKDRFVAHSKRFLANLKGSANAHFR